MSAEQWAAMMRGDESYAGARSWFRLEEVVRNLTGVPYVFPTHQGRAAERILCSVVPLTGRVVLSNGLFDTTRANVEAAGRAGHRPAPCRRALGRRRSAGTSTSWRSTPRSSAHGDEVAFVVMTVTNNTVGGQAVSHGEPRARSAKRCKRRGVLARPRRVPLRGERLPHPRGRARRAGAHAAWPSRARCSISATPSR